jgi:hypothetical protein
MRKAWIGKILSRLAVGGRLNNRHWPLLFDP